MSTHGQTKMFNPNKKVVEHKPGKCGYCGKRLSMYNENLYCFAHITHGYKSEQQEEEERRQKNAKLLAKSREKAKCK